MASRFLKDENGKFIYRQYYVTNKLEFSKWIEINEVSVNDSIQKFIKSSDWIWYENYYEVKYQSHKTENFNLTVNISVKPMTQKELKQARKL